MKFRFLSFLLLPLFGIAQTITVNDYDKFIKKQRIETEPVLINTLEKSKVSISYSALASDFFLRLTGNGWGASTIDVDNILILLFDNDSTVTVKSTGFQTYEPGIAKSSYKHQYHISATDIEMLSRNTLVGIRKYMFRDFTDLSVPRENSEKIKLASALFLTELKKANVLKVIKTINLEDIDKHIGDSVAFCTKIYNTRYLEAATNKPTLLYVQPDFSTKLVSPVIFEEDRKNFNNQPEKLYQNKDVCITGLVELRNGSPFIAIHNRNQIRLATSIAASEAPLFIGDSVTVTGKIFTGKFFDSSQTLPTLLNMGAAYPDQPLTLVIEQKDRKNFVEKPESYYINRDVMVSGRIVLYKNTPQIIVRNTDQIKVVTDGPVMLAKADDNHQALQNNYTQSKTIAPVIANGPPSFPGGVDSLMNFLSINLKYPDSTNRPESKTVVTSFVVDADGTLSNIQITKSGGIDYDKQALKILQLMPKWIPGTLNGKAVSQTYTLPVSFKGEVNEMR